MTKTKRGVVLRILQTTRRLVKSRYGEPRGWDRSRGPRPHPTIGSAIARATELVEDTDRDIGHYGEYHSTAIKVVNHVQRQVLGTSARPFFEEGNANTPSARARALRIVDAAIRVVHLDDKLFA